MKSIYEVYRSQLTPMGLVIIERLSLIATHDSSVSQSNKEGVMSHTLRLVKCGLPFTLIPQHGRIMRLQ